VEKATPAADHMKAAQAVSPTDDSAVYADIKLCQGSKTVCIPVTFDSGCVLSVLPAKYYKGHLKPVKVQLVAANNTPLSVSGQARVMHFLWMALSCMPTRSSVKVSMSFCLVTIF
jgi:hypothetical protein